MTEKYTETRTFDSDTAMSIFGVAGRLKRRTVCYKTKVGCWEHQDWISERRTKVVNGEKVLMHATIRFDDECHNGENSFSITGHGWYDHYKSRDWDFGGCCHEMIAEVFPELAPLIKWHLVGADSPMHYIANTVYLASNRDHNGLLKGETRQLRNGKTGLPVWERAVFDQAGERIELPQGFNSKWLDAETPPADEAVTLRWVPVNTTGEGKEREFDKARNSACWPEATDEQLCLPEAELRALLEARLPGLQAEFRKAMDEIGMLWSPEDFK